ncbi:MAG: hypothetical protein FWG45_02910 [Oscillospiraceae bacterium]|nr:hypothetical protein [Oscillospiraceae bacterium]
MKDFRCPGCDAALPIPESARETVVCSHCGGSVLWERNTNNQNAEIAAKQDINSGVALCTPPVRLHFMLVDALCASPVVPLDVFDNVEVLSEERYYVPSYCFSCSAQAAFSYELGVERQRQKVVGSGSNKRIVNENYTEWTPQSSLVSVSPTIFASGNRRMTPPVKTLYATYQTANLIDVEELVFPPDCVTMNYDYPVPALFGEHVKPAVDATLANQARTQVGGRNVKDFIVNPGNVQRDVTRVLLGLYRITFRYNGGTFVLWVTGDGRQAFNEGLPTDLSRRDTLAAMEKQLNDMGAQHASMNQKAVMLSVLTCGIYWFAANAGGLKRERITAIEAHKSAISAYKAELDSVKNAFRARKGILKGIYANITP